MKNISRIALEIQYAGSIGLLCQCSRDIKGDKYNAIVRAVQDWCDMTGWVMTDNGTNVTCDPPN